jgi:hypothetical protein
MLKCSSIIGSIFIKKKKKIKGWLHDQPKGMKVEYLELLQ